MISSRARKTNKKTLTFRELPRSNTADTASFIICVSHILRKLSAKENKRSFTRM
jgi:hypothetical protein